MSEDIQKLKDAVNDLQAKLSDEGRRRADLERRCSVLEKLAYRDPDTGLRTKDYLRTRVREEIERAIRYPSATTLLTLCTPPEHAERLPQLGRQLAKELRESDHVFSLDQTGIAILLLETPQDGAKHLIERLETYLEHFIAGYGYTVTSFPVDTNMADEFFSLMMKRHAEMDAKVTSHPPQGSTAAHTGTVN